MQIKTFQMKANSIIIILWFNFIWRHFPRYIRSVPDLRMAQENFCVTTHWKCVELSVPLQRARPFDELFPVGEKFRFKNTNNEFISAQNFLVSTLAPLFCGARSMRPIHHQPWLANQRKEHSRHRLRNYIWNPFLFLLFFYCCGVKYLAMVSDRLFPLVYAFLW